MFAAYCESDIPAQPLYAYNTTSLSRDDVGQLVTYHCWTGFGFSGPPVPVTTPAPTTVTGRRRRRSVDSLTQREVECVPWDGGTRGYWSYQYEIPSRCYSKHRLTISLSQSNFSSRELLQVRTGDDGSSKEYRDLADCQHSVLRYELQVRKGCT